MAPDQASTHAVQRKPLPSPEELLQEYIEVMRLETLSDKYGASVYQIRQRMLQTGNRYKAARKLISKKREERWRAYYEELKKNRVAHPPRLPKRTPEQLAEEYIELQSIKKVAQKHGISAERVRQVLTLKPDLYSEACNTVAQKKKDWCYNEFLKVLKHFGYIPSIAELKDHNSYLANTHIYYPLRKKAESEGYAHNTFRYRSIQARKAEMISYLKELAAELNHTPCKREIHQKGKYWAAHYVYYFGSLTKAQQVAGLKPNKRGGQRSS